METLSPPSSDIVFLSGDLEARQADDGWIFVFWITNDKGRLSKQMVKNLRMIEKAISANPALRGWICSSEREHAEMHKLIRKFGADDYGSDDEMLFFKKEINHVR